MTTPRALGPGDCIGIAAPASPFDRGMFLKGIRAIEKLGFRTKHRKDIFDQNRYFAGSEQRRADELMELLCDREIKAIMFARGGYGSQRVIPLLDAGAAAANPKPIVGFSDLTALLTFMRQKAGVPTFYGPVVTQLGLAQKAETLESLRRALSTSGPLGEMEIGSAKTLKPGRASGRLAGGCLTLINSSIGTPYELETSDSILFLEDTGEKVYALDRMITQLWASGALAKARAVIIGDVTPPEGETHDIDAMLSDVLEKFEGPVVERFPAGHTSQFVTLPMGVRAELLADAEGCAPSLRITEGLLS